MDPFCAKLLTQVAEPSNTQDRKISVVGAGRVGMACAVSLLTQNVTNHIALVDSDENKLMGEMMDLQHGSSFVNCPKIEASSDLSVTAGSRVCVVTARASHKPGESCVDVLQRNLKVFTKIIPGLVENSPNAVILIVSSPVDILTYVAWKLSGLPSHKVIGSGTNLDSARLRHLISEQLEMSSESCHGWVIGDHGDSSVAVWSGVNVAGVRLPRRPLPELDYFPGEQETADCFSLLHKQVVESAEEVVWLKGYTCWAIALSVADICRAIINNTQTVHAVSTLVQGVHHVKSQVFLSLPCVLGKDGVTRIIKQPLKDEELKKFKKSANTTNDIIQEMFDSGTECISILSEDAI